MCVFFYLRDCGGNFKIDLTEGIVFVQLAWFYDLP